MQDFLKDRPSVERQDVKMVAPATTTDTGSAVPFARIVRDEAAAAAAARRPAVAPAKPAAPGNAAAPHTSQVKTVLENGRVSRIIVTCSCGKVTEIACVY